jgi:putative tryptophan/tyrosine transport system substrate-binding protein
MELLKEIVPNLSRLAVLWDPKNPAAAQQWKQSHQPAKELGLQLHSMPVSSAGDFDGAFKEATKARSDALLATQNTLVASNKNRYWAWSLSINCQRFTLRSRTLALVV